MRTHATKANALREQGACGESGNAVSNDILSDLTAQIKRLLLNGQQVRLINYAALDRGYALAAIATLRDELPIRCGWQTVRESHASETRTRARTYSIPGVFLRESE